MAGAWKEYGGVPVMVMSVPANAGAGDSEVELRGVLTGDSGPHLFPLVFRSGERGACVVTLPGVPGTSGATEGGSSVPAFAPEGAGTRLRGKAWTRIAATTRRRKRPAAETRAGIFLQ
jgi:hypothetical protein